MQKYVIYKVCGAIGITGSVIVVASDLIGIAVHEAHDPISDTISMLAIGKYGWIQDWGLDMLALGYFALAVGLFTWKRKGIKWIISLIILVLISVNLVFIAEHNQYASRPGYNMHRELVYILAGLFFVLNILISFDLKYLNPVLKKFSLWIAALWIVFAPLLFLIPDALDGAYERLICTSLVVWPAVTSYYLLKYPDSKLEASDLNNMFSK